MNTSERIDVLAVMDSDRGDAVMARAARYKAEHAIALERRSVEARAAVAELIGFAEGMRELLSQDGAPVWAAGALDQLQSVLARVQGGA